MTKKKEWLPFEEERKIKNLIVQDEKTLEFIEKSKKIHGEKYDYSKVQYKNALKKVIIICKIHGEFLQSPSNHYNGSNCPICSGSTVLSFSDFVKSKMGSIIFYKFSYINEWINKLEDLTLKFTCNVAFKVYYVDEFVVEKGRMIIGYA